MTQNLHPLLQRAQTQGIHFEMNGAVAMVRLSRPSKRNALNDGLVEALRDVFQNLPEEAKAAVVYGEGDHFCAGLDLSELKERDITYAAPLFLTAEFTNNITGEIKFNKNGYELRTDILEMAKDVVQKEYAMKFQGWELTAKRDEKTGQLVSTVTMPEFPGLDKILETAEKMYGFVNQSTTKK